MNAALTYRTVAQMRADDAKAFNTHGMPRATILDPAAGECAPLFTSRRFNDCLTHITRVISANPDRSEWFGHPSPPYDWATGWCGVIMNARQIALADATGFACAGCISRCEEYGLPTFSLVPDTGCSVSGGKRGRRKP